MYTWIGVAAFIMASYLAWTFLVRPRLSTLRVNGWHFETQNNILTIRIGRGDDNVSFTGRLDRLLIHTTKGRDEHTRHQGATDFIETTYTVAGNAVFVNETVTHNKAYNYTVKGARFAMLTLTEIRPQDLTQALCKEGERASCVRGLMRNAKRVAPNTREMRMSRMDALVAKMWLARRGARGKVDTSDMEQAFDQRVADIRENYRLRFGYQGTQLDHVGIADNLDAMSYSMLGTDMRLTIYSEEFKAVKKAATRDVHFETEIFQDGRATRTYAFYDRIGVPISPKMRDLVERERKALGLPAITVKHRNA